MASAFLGQEDPFALDSAAPPTYEFGVENAAPMNWRYDSWGMQPVVDNFSTAMEDPYTTTLSPLQDSDDSVTDLDELSSHTPSSPSSDMTPAYEYGMTDDMSEVKQEWTEPTSVSEEEEEDSCDAMASTQSTSLMSAHTSALNQDMDVTTTTHSTMTAPPAPVSTPASAPSQKRRGRPRTKAAAAPVSLPPAQYRKRRAENIQPESLLGTKKSKSSSSLPSLLDRLPSSISAVELQSMSSADFDAYYAAVAPKLSKSEMEIAKQQRRRIKNRESASNSRVRKQDNLAELEAQVQQLREQNETLKQKALAIQSEHRAMSRELDSYKRLVREHLPPQFVPSFFASTSASGSGNFSSNGTSTASNGTGSNASSNGNVVHITTRQGRSTRVLARDAASAALMCLVLFAVIWGSSTVFPSSVFHDAQIGLNSPSRLSFPLPDGPFMAPVSSSTSLIPASSALQRRNAHTSIGGGSSSSSAAETGDGAWLANVLQQQQALLPPQRALPSEVSVVTAQSTSSEPTTVKPRDLAVSGTLEPADMDIFPTPSGNDALLVATEEVKPTNETMLNAHLGGTPIMATSSSSASTPTGPTAVQHTTYAPQWKQNTTYIKCDSMQHVIPPAGAQPPVDPNAPLFISLWVNPTALDGSPISSASKDPFSMDCLMQVTCQIVSVEQLGHLGATTESSRPLPNAPEHSMPSALAQSSS